MRYKLGVWYQIGGDVNAAKHGVVLGRLSLSYVSTQNVRCYETEIIRIDNLLACCGRDAFLGDDPFAVTERSFSDRELRNAFAPDAPWRANVVDKERAKRNPNTWAESCDVLSWLPETWPQAFGPDGEHGDWSTFNVETPLTHAARFAIAESIVSYSGGNSTQGGPEVCPATFTAYGGRSGRRDAGFYAEAAVFRREKREHLGRK